MKRTIIYHINAEEDGLTIGQFLKRKKYTGQNLTQLKKREQGILLNSKPAYVIHKLAEGDTLKYSQRQKPNKIRLFGALLFSLQVLL